jgi:class 3 adenylate cyclase
VATVAVPRVGRNVDAQGRGVGGALIDSADESLRARRFPQQELASARSSLSSFFCDLVGFTAASEDVVPEDVKARLRRYCLRLREELEAFAGTVEKFIGDPVMGVFGVPSAREDDPEQAVRAALPIVDAIADLNDGRADAQRTSVARR